jgi:hypothetical protein
MNMDEKSGKWAEAVREVKGAESAKVWRNKELPLVESLLEFLKLIAAPIPTFNRRTMTKVVSASISFSPKLSLNRTGMNLA